jgi:NitT/TauT family transport system substrate-binding protein
MGKRWMMVLAVLLLTAAAGTGVFSKTTQRSGKIAIAEQYGLAYAPLQVMKELRLLEKEYPGIRVQWRQLGNTAAIREAMVAGEIDAGFMAIPPFLIGFDKGMDWKIASGLSESPVILLTNQARIKSIRDFGVKDRVALPQPGSIQHILLAMACDKEWGDPKRLDNLLVTLAHPDGMNALLAGKEITAHFTTPPYLNRELEQPGIRRILDGREAMGTGFTFVVGVTTKSLYEKRNKEYRAFCAALNQAIGYVRRNPEKTAKLLTGQYKIPVVELEKLLTAPGNEYTTKIRGVERFAGFMVKAGYLSKMPDVKELFWSNANHE